MCIYIVKIWFRIANGKFCQLFTEFMCLPYDSGGVLSFNFLDIFDLANYLWVELHVWEHYI